MMIVMCNLVAKTEAERVYFRKCYRPCVKECQDNSTFLDYLVCPYKCIKTCLPWFSTSSIDDKDTIDQTHAFCKLGCAVNQCAYLPTSENQISDHEEVALCVESCSERCSNKN
ncbi:unnamed protein product [Cochlearia groenlandica]